MELFKLSKLTDEDQATTINVTCIIFCNDALLGERHALKNTSIPLQYNEIF